MSEIERNNNRKFDDLRETTIERNYLKYPEGSVLISQGDTKVIVAASIVEYVPRFLVDTGTGWLTAEYNMLPGATQSRYRRERGHRTVKGRTHEIQRLIGRSLRAAFDYESIGERTIKVDCDVLQADGGTRCASITGGFIAAYDAISYLYNDNLVYEFPEFQFTAAISLGIKDGKILLDLDYSEDSTVDVDFNLVMNENLELLEIQGTAEGKPFKKEQLTDLVALGEKGILELIEMQKQILG
ncbi:MAG: ribonuclease PH [Promethearchaeia archaeon]